MIKRAVVEVEGLSYVICLYEDGLLVNRVYADKVDIAMPDLRKLEE